MYNVGIKGTTLVSIKKNSKNKKKKKKTSKIFENFWKKIKEAKKS
jgi:hypothetical protein